ncbi:hypothetical protein ACFQV8_24285 [Pseudonocardia benzenivorans]
MFDRIRALFGKPRTAEDDVRPDADVARTRAAGGRDTERGDSGSTTGVGRSEEFVGRAAPGRGLRGRDRCRDPSRGLGVSSYDAVVLDVDGTLVDSNYQHALAWYRAFRRHDLTLPVWRLHQGHRHGWRPARRGRRG